MQTFSDLAKFPKNPDPPRLQIQDHPVFQALPSEARRQAELNSALLMLSPDEDIQDDEALYFILAGMLGLFPDGRRICVSVVVAGSVHGWDQAMDPTALRSTARPLINTHACRVPAACVLESLGPDWLTRLVARQAQTRLHVLAAEAACNASHLVKERLAKWLVRLYCGAHGAPLRLTQADFAAMLGVQRTSINAAAARLQDQDLVRFGRGKVEVIDLAGLRRASCGCGEPPSKLATMLQIPSYPSDVDAAFCTPIENTGLPLVRFNGASRPS